jgi:hypothetical protein
MKKEELKPILRTELREIFGKFQNCYACAGRDPWNSYLKYEMWKDGELHGRTKAERMNRIALLITAHINHKGAKAKIPPHWLAYAEAQKYSKENGA